MGFIGQIFEGDPEFEGAYTPEEIQQRKDAMQARLAAEAQFGQELAALSGSMPITDVYNRFGQVADQGMEFGPDVAGAKLAQDTAANVAQTGALMGSARGAAANPALLARSVAQQSGSLQQQAAGQAATMRAQQQLEQARLQQALKMDALSRMGALSQGALQAQTQQNQYLTGATAGDLGAALTSKAQADASTSGAAGKRAGLALDFVGGLLKGAGTAATKASTGGMGAYKGGKVPSLMSFLSAEGGKVPGRAVVKGDSPKNDLVPAMLSPGEIVVPRSQANDPKKAAAFAAAVARRGNGKKK